MSDELTFEQAAKKLEDTLKLLESSDLSLEDAVKAAEQATVYLRVCTELLAAARHKIEIRPEPTEDS
jgi:exodeoxyribonuclease VII small subunit